MSATLHRYRDVLRHASDRLNLPQPARSRVLLEIAGDLEDLHAHYLAEGLDDAAALRRLRTEYALSDDALADLAALHGGPLRRLLDGLSAQTRSLWERGLLLGLLAFAALAAGQLLLTRDFFALRGPFLWPVLALALVAFALALRHGWRILTRGTRELRLLRRELNALPALAVAQLALGGLGAWLELGRGAWAGRVEPSQVGPRMADAFQAGVALAIVAQVCALLAGLAWFILERRVRAAEMHEALLLQGILAEDENTDEGRHP
ncbi:MAG: hypothetical protein H6693_07805 [Candidatus Latescibacteria bacterium]|nr:hypothetical protein [Candidatus Latescibacterota bacterium]